MKVIQLSSLLALLMVLTLPMTTIGCAGHYHSTSIRFQSGGDTLAGVLTTPRERSTNPSVLLIFVHGDGAMPADSHGYYSPIWKKLADAGIASLAWNKKGVGESEGDWLSQSMGDRAQEVIDALEHIASQYPNEFPVIGLIGFSQAGWVLPEVAYRSATPRFMIVVSGAINWQRQGKYLTRQRLALAGESPMDVEKEVRRQTRDAFLYGPEISYAEYTGILRDRCSQPDEVCEEPLSEARYGFVKRNRMADATERLQQVTIPTFALFGDRDRNVDYQESFDTYRRSLVNGPAGRSHFKIYPNATHGLLNVDEFDTATPNWWTMVKLAWQADKAFAEGVLDDIVAFAGDEASRHTVTGENDSAAR